MPIKADGIKIIKQYKNNKSINLKKVKTEVNLVQYIEEYTNERKEIILNQNIFTACSWLIWSDLLIKDKTTNSKASNSYKRRKLIKVELGTDNIGSEASFEHPAVVLYEEWDWLLIAPITSKKFGKELDLLVDIPKGACSGLPENSTVQLDHIRAISKKRVSETLKGSLPTYYMDRINEVMLKYYIPPLYEELTNLKQSNKSLRQENMLLRNERIKLQEDLLSIIDEKKQIEKTIS